MRDHPLNPVSRRLIDGEAVPFPEITHAVEDGAAFEAGMGGDERGTWARARADAATARRVYGRCATREEAIAGLRGSGLDEWATALDTGEYVGTVIW